MTKHITEQVMRSSGNVFTDMGLPDAAELDTKARLGVSLNLIIQGQRLTQSEVTTALGINQRQVSSLMNYEMEGFSVERLIHFLAALGQDEEPTCMTNPQNPLD